MEFGKKETQSQQNTENNQTGLKIFWSELRRDKLALLSFVLLIVIVVFVYGISFVMNQDEVAKIDLFSIHEPPSKEFILGTDYGGRDVFGQLIIGTRNSLSIGFIVTFLSGVIGVVFGLVAGYFGGHIDNILMRVLDFFQVLPFIMLVIVFVSIVPNYTIVAFSLIFTAFSWMGIARLIRSKALQEKELDYVQASKTLGTSHFKIIFREVMPNISSLIIVTMTLNLASNIGLESGLSFLGFGFPESTPSLGTLLSYATNPQTLEHRWWIWFPAAVMIIVLMLAVRNVGEALRRATDARQRRG